MVKFTKNVNFHSKDSNGKNVVTKYKEGDVVDLEDLPHKDVGSFAERVKENTKKDDTKKEAEAKAKAEKEEKEKAEAEAKAKAGANK